MSRIRPAITTTVSPDTLDAIDAEVAPGEGRGQVIDRWARDRAAGRSACLPLDRVPASELRRALRDRES